MSDVTGPYETLVVDAADTGVVTLTLNRPDRGNAQTSAMFDELDGFARAVTADPSVRAVLITGAGKAFCVGYDLAGVAELPSMGVVAYLELQERAARALSAIRGIRVPVIAAVNGAAAGGGLALSLASDIRLASPEAKFNAAFVRIGLSAGDLGTSWLLPRLIGTGAAAEITFTGRIVPADEAERLGLVNRVVRKGEVLDAARAMAEQICANSPAGVEVSKRALQSNLEIGSYAAALDLENRGQTLLTRTRDFQEATQAFLEKRPPVFRGE
ncbi:enoyl-CoA hydratase/isomerase family protein [Microbacterium aurum]